MRNILRNEKGATSLEATIIMACFVFVTVITILAMCNAGGIDSDTLDEVQAEICEELCEMDYRNGLDNVVQYQKCMAECTQ